MNCDQASINWLAIMWPLIDRLLQPSFDNAAVNR